MTMMMTMVTYLERIMKPKRKKGRKRMTPGIQHVSISHVKERGTGKERRGMKREIERGREGKKEKRIREREREKKRIIERERKEGRDERNGL